MTLSAARTPASELDGRLLFARDAKVAFALLNHARYRSLERYLGIPRDQANLATVILLMIVGEGVYRQARRLSSLPGAPSVDEVVMSGASVRGLIWEVTGMPGDEPPLFGPLIALALAVPPVRRAVLASARGVRGSVHRMTVDFHSRYGYLVDHGHWRQQRAARSKLTSGASRSAQAGG